MKLLTLLIVACCLTLGCAGGMLPAPDASIQPIKVEPQASLTQAPAQLPPLEPGQNKGKDLEANHQQASKAYHLLATRFCNLLVYLEINREQCKYWLDSD